MTASGLSRWDEHLIHQTGAPLFEAQPEQLAVDRFHLLAHDDGRHLLGMGLGQYRTAGVMDAIVYLVVDGEQRTLRLSRHVSPSDFADVEIGPVAVEVVEPFKRWRWRLDERPAFGVSFDLTFEAAQEPFLYRPFDFARSTGSTSRFNHYIQVGRFTGDLLLDGVGTEVDWVAVRDRTWGVRADRERQGLHFWVHSQLGDDAVYFTYNEHRDGSLAYLDGAVVVGGEQRPLTALRHALAFGPDGKLPTRYEFELTDDRGERLALTYEPTLTGYIGGLGYGGWHGKDRGPRYEEAERIDTRLTTEQLLERQPILVFDQVCRIVSAEGTHAGNVQFGITRSDAYTYRPTIGAA
jgi:hypothetical protein